MTVIVMFWPVDINVVNGSLFPTRSVVKVEELAITELLGDADNEVVIEDRDVLGWDDVFVGESEVDREAEVEVVFA